MAAINESEYLTRLLRELTAVLRELGPAGLDEPTRQELSALVEQLGAVVWPARDWPATDV